MDDHDVTRPPSAALQTLALLLAITIVSMAFATLLTALAYVTDSSAAVELEADLVPPLVVTRGEDRWQMEGAQTSVSIADASAVGEFGDFSPETVRGTVRVQRDDGAGAATYRTGLTVMGLLGIVALVALRRIVVGARDDRPFSAENVRRLRVAGLCALGIAVAGDATERVLAHVVDVGTAVRLDPELLPWWPFVLLAAGALALAEIFRRGAELHDFEQLAI
ncbi:MAG TPA: DUF2975 domain-containing protein [Acidimicrobiales bacterium]|nr:DUF2975 domain-containing protein [Acidimicrobiales bacterium]